MLGKKILPRDGKIAKWWTPDDAVFVDAPLGARGKINKRQLREMFKDFTLPTV
ncbi:MAG: hypothetical protein MRY64_09455 [Hyphomonadaceae bacterium]|nr:hypothetical protein [Hyphomonadaceae bacterium]